MNEIFFFFHTTKLKLKKKRKKKRETLKEIENSWVATFHWGWLRSSQHASQVKLLIPLMRFEFYKEQTAFETALASKTGIPVKNNFGLCWLTCQVQRNSYVTLVEPYGNGVASAPFFYLILFSRITGLV